MSGNSLVVDTNIVLYLLSGDETVAALLNDRQIYLSFITELELLGYREQKYGLKLPDTIIAATALFLDFPLISADNDFSKIKELEQLLYKKE